MAAPPTTAARPAVSTAGLSRSYGEKVALDGIDLRIPEGTVCRGAPSSTTGGWLPKARRRS